MLNLYNTLTREKAAFTPIDASNVRMYVCGPTVYARPHLGNARSVVVYDALFRLLQHLYGSDQVTYARNITDVDDKINVAARERGITIQALTQEITAAFHADTKALNCLRPSIEPRATEHIDHIIALIEQLIAKGNAYAAQGHVLFDVTSQSANHHWQYGMLSGRNIEEMEAGARIEVASYKKNPGDFVLWKPSLEGDDESSKFQSPWGVGRPGWHIECSAMSTTHLGKEFDIHGGGADLKFPHHENEIAQSCCAYPESRYAHYWVHNGFLTVNGEKMSKSLGNFIILHELLDQGIKGEVIRLALLMSKYNEPMDWNDKLVSDAQKLLDKGYRVIGESDVGDQGAENRHPEEAKLTKDLPSRGTIDPSAAPQDDAFLQALCDDLNTPKALSVLQSELMGDASQLKAAGDLLGIFQHDPEQWFKGAAGRDGLSESEIEAQIQARKDAKANKDYALSDQIRDELKAQGVILEDKPGGAVEWRRA